MASRIETKNKLKKGFEVKPITNGNIDVPDSAKLRTFNIYGTFEGCLSMLCPVDETIYKRLAALNVQLTLNLPHVAGLNPIAHRAYKRTQINHYTTHKGILDMELASSFLNLDFKTQKRLGRTIGVSPALIIDHIQSIRQGTQLYPDV